jgi:hypothetical protein
MPKTLTLAVFVATIAFSPAYAASELCTDAHMQQMDKMIAGMTDAEEGGDDASRHVEGRDEEGQRSRVRGAHGRSP